MAKLTDTQLIILSKAAQRDDSAALGPDKMNKMTRAKVGVILVDRKLMREIRAKPGMPVWREDDDRRRFSLIITKAGRDAIGIGGHGEEFAALPVAADNDRVRAPELKVDAERESAGAGAVGALRASGPPRPGSKQALVVDMLSGENGATVDALIAVTGWLPHTTRAALTALRKRGYAIERSGAKGSPTIYRIAANAVRLNSTTSAAA